MKHEVIIKMKTAFGVNKVVTAVILTIIAAGCSQMSMNASVAEVVMVKENTVEIHF